jgi:PHP family Zn ribbon phosphoesterase
MQLLTALGGELGILLDAPLDAISEALSLPVAEAVGRMRAGEVVIHPGYDGHYGAVHIAGADRPA